MGAAGGGSGIGRGSIPSGRDFAPAPAGTEQANVGGTPGQVAGAAQAGAAEALTPAQLKAKIEAEAEKSGVDSRRQGIVGPSSTSEGMKDVDKEVGEKVFVANGVPSPFNANTTPALYAKIKDTKEFSDSVAACKAFLANPTDANKAALVKTASGFTGINGQPVVDTRGQPIPGTGSNIMEVLYLVFRDSIKETNEDKKYYLTKLQEYNQMGEELSKYLHELADASRELGARAAGAKYPEMELTAAAVEIKQYDLSALGTDGKLHATETTHKHLDRTGLNETIKEVESMQETVRNKRQMASTAFQNFDQKANQLYNLLSSVMKAFNEMRSGVVRNML